MIDWQWCVLGELSPQQFYAVFAAREAVFVVEQACAYQEMDGLDLAATHLIGWAPVGGANAGSAQTGLAHTGSVHIGVAAYLRLLDPGARYAEPSIGRILTSQAFRSSGLGRVLVAKALERLDAKYPAHGVRISAQARLERFYASFGFVVASEPYLEDGIPHVEMLRPG